jgi:hypothetical protein
MFSEYLGPNIVAIQEQLTGNESLITEVTGTRTSVIDCTHRISGAI